MPEVARCPLGRVDLHDLPSQGIGLPRQGCDEGVNGVGVLDVPEQLAGPAAGQIAPLEWGVFIREGDAPSSSRHGDRGAVPAGHQRNPLVGEGKASAAVDGPVHESEPFQRIHEL